MVTRRRTCFIPVYIQRLCLRSTEGLKLHSWRISRTMINPTWDFEHGAKKRLKYGGFPGLNDELKDHVTMMCFTSQYIKHANSMVAVSWLTKETHIYLGVMTTERGTTHLYQATGFDKNLKYSVCFIAFAFASCNSSVFRFIILLSHLKWAR